MDSDWRRRLGRWLGMAAGVGGVALLLFLSSAPLRPPTDAYQAQLPGSEVPPSYPNMSNCLPSPLVERCLKWGQKTRRRPE